MERRLEGGGTLRMRPATRWKSAPVVMRMTERKQQREEGQRGAEQVQPARWDTCVPGDVTRVEIREAAEVGTDGVYREGRRPPARRWGCAACPKASSPSTCC